MQPDRHDYDPRLRSGPSTAAGGGRQRSAGVPLADRIAFGLASGNSDSDPSIIRSAVVAGTGCECDQRQAVAKIVARRDPDDLKTRSKFCCFRNDFRQG